MTMDVASFIGNFQGGARPNRFQVILTFPFDQGLGGLSLNASLGAILGPVSAGTGISLGSASTAMSFLCNAASIPESNVNSIRVPYMGREVPVAGDRQFADWNVTCYNDENFNLRNAFEVWLDAINSHVGNIRRPTTNNYFSNAIVQQLSTTGAVLKQYKFWNLFPTNLSDIQLGFANNDTVEEFNVNFAYSYWSSDTTQ